MKIAARALTLINKKGEQTPHLDRHTRNESRQAGKRHTRRSVRSRRRPK